MPQGKKDRPASRKARSKGQAMRRELEASKRTKRGLGAKKPKRKAAMGSRNESYERSLPKMVRDFEMMAAGKLLGTGATLRAPHLKEAGKEQIRMMREQSKVVKRVSMKGLRGPQDDYDVDRVVGGGGELGIADPRADLNPVAARLATGKNAISAGTGRGKGKHRAKGIAAARAALLAKAEMLRTQTAGARMLATLGIQSSADLAEEEERVKEAAKAAKNAVPAIKDAPVKDVPTKDAPTATKSPAKKAASKKAAIKDGKA